MKKIALIAAMGSLFAAAPAWSASTIMFDRDGVGGTSAIAVNTFDWIPASVLAVDAIGGGAAPFTTYSQGRLFGFLDAANNPIGVPTGEFTYQLSVVETATGIGGATAAFFLGGASSFQIFYDTSVDSNDLSGAGYGDGVLIMSGVVTNLTGSFTDFTALSGGLIPAQLLDQSANGNDWGATMTHQGNGSNTFDIDVLFQNNDFFKSNVSSLVVDANTTTNLAVPFNQANPAKNVMGHTPSLGGVGGLMNGAACDPADTNGKCDMIFQSDASTSFNTASVPEPGVLALLGLGLVGLGFSKRRQK